IDAAISQATAAAAAIPQENAQQNGGTAVAPASPNQGAVAAGRPMGLDDAMAGAVVVDDWLKVNEHGLQIGAKKPLLEEIKVRIDLGDVAYSES
ncbi:hypothetical protein, partial [Mesorhizobium sp. M00.F.Ca.ET.216.01.1.1]